MKFPPPNIITTRIPESTSKINEGKSELNSIMLIIMSKVWIRASLLLNSLIVFYFAWVVELVFPTRCTVSEVFIDFSYLKKVTLLKCFHFSSPPFFSTSILQVQDFFAIVDAYKRWCNTEPLHGTGIFITWACILCNDVVAVSLWVFMCVKCVYGCLWVSGCLLVSVCV